MKKLLLVLWVLLALSAQKVFAQCTPDPNLTYNGISPETLPDAIAGYYYTTTLSFKIPRDSSISGINVTIDSAKLVGIIGKPLGFAFNCNTKECSWPGGTKGCALFFGTVDSSFTDSVIEYPMKIYTQTWYRFTGGADQFSRLDSATNFTFRILKYNGIAEVLQYEKLTAYPNPTSGAVTIELRDLQQHNSRVQIIDAFGKRVYDRTISENTSFLNTLSVDLSNYGPGIYMVTVQSGDRVGLSKVVLR
jgi:hypothetical protein